MAHADYDCCACCDRKMAYNSDAKTKEDLCAACAVDLAQEGVFCRNAQAFLAFVQSPGRNQVQRVLRAVGFQPCLYPNAVDDSVKDLDV